MTINFRRRAFYLIGLVILGATLVGVEARTFTDNNGKSMEAELMAFYGDRISVRFPSGKTSEILLSTLSVEDRKYAKDWSEGKKVKVSAGDLQLKIEKFTKPAPAPKKKKGKGGGKSMMTNYRCTLDNYSLKRMEGLKVNYTVYKRINLVGGTSSNDRVEVFKFTKQLGPLEPTERIPFQTKFVVATDSSSKNQKRNETVIGIVMDFKVGNRTILKQSCPEVFIRRLEEEKARQAIRDREERKREETRAKEEALRRGSQERIDKMDR